VSLGYSTFLKDYQPGPLSPRLNAWLTNLVAEYGPEELEAGNGELMQRIATKEALVEDLIAGRRGLLDVAARFRVLDADTPACMTVIRRAVPAATDEECICRNVINYVKCYLGCEAEGHESLRRLNTELERWLAEGNLTLPELPPEGQLPQPGKS
jgi:hypothetical protein